MSSKRQTPQPPLGRRAGKDRTVTATPVDDRARTEPRLTRADVAGIAGYSSAGTVTTLLSRARERRRELAKTRPRPAHLPVLFPEPDGHFGRTPFWYESTVRKYLSERSEPGQPAMHGQHQEDAAPGVCPVCGKDCPGSVASHRYRRAVCSYDPKVRKAAADYGQKWLVEKAEQDRPGTCPVCQRGCETSVTAHRNGRQECSFDPTIRSAARR